jgi:glutamate synthase domain-containing protein 1
MLLAVGCRGPDSTGVALYGPPSPHTTLRVKPGDGPDASRLIPDLIAVAEQTGSLISASQEGAYLRLVVAKGTDTLVARLEALAADVEVISVGRQLEIVKQVGGPEALEETYGISEFTGTHGIGHTRLSTESKIDLSHSQPFWAHGLPDVATAHNGHITNYHQMRRRDEQRGIRYYTENDSEIIGIYLRARMQAGYSFEEALQSSLHDFDGSFCYLAATANTIAFVKDPFGLKPLVFAETDSWVAIATEEIALRNALPGSYRVHEARTSQIMLWNVEDRQPVGV